jgi:hypothetical protein
MTKSEYLSNSAKLLSISSIILFVANAFIFAGMFSSELGAYGEKVSNYTFYIVFALNFLALNGESIGYKRHRDFKNRKFTRVLKYILLFTFLIRFIKKPVESLFLFIGGKGVTLILSKLFLGFFNTFATYGFLFTMISLLYLMRDKDENKLFYIESATFFSGILCAVYRSFNYSVTKYELTEIGDGLVTILSNDYIKYVLVLVEFLLFIIMCFIVRKHFDSKILDEQDEKIKARKNMLVAPKIYNTDHLGLDTLEDDFLLPQETDEY